MQLPMDKLMHFTVGVVLGAVVGISTGNPLSAVIAASIAGIGKEVYDNVTGGDVEAMDVLATTAGGLVSGVLVAFVNYMG